LVIYTDYTDSVQTSTFLVSVVDIFALCMPSGQ